MFCKQREVIHQTTLGQIMQAAEQNKGHRADHCGTHSSAWLDDCSTEDIGPDAEGVERFVTRKCQYCSWC